jgi:precorrin-6A/cobalt-precorrin-6A reductase
VTRRVLVLGGTAEARRLATELAGRAGVHVISSLAGRVRTPTLPAGEVRIGGFGGPDGLAGWLAEHRVDAVVDATHPFAQVMTANAVQATGRLGLPLLVLRRPGWQPSPGDDWHWVGSLPAAAEALPGLGRRVFLTTGRQGVAAFAGLAGLWFLLRCVDPPQPPVPAGLEVLLDRGPFTVAGELDLLRRYRIDVLVTKDSGGELTAAKLTAAGRLGLPVVVLTRPPLPAGAPSVGTVEEAAAWVAALPR